MTRNTLLKGNIMPNKLIVALKENKNDIRKKLAIGVGITIAAVAAGVLLTKYANDQREVLLVTPVEFESLPDIDIPTE